MDSSFGSLEDKPSKRPRTDAPVEFQFLSGRAVILSTEALLRGQELMKKINAQLEEEDKTGSSNKDNSNQPLTREGDIVEPAEEMSQTEDAKDEGF